ncbi:DUF86 domain-containing protein [Candidatus Saccharibacteria bacterium]|nr:DUF86 domain-containing protein [Candidatus Saccharibacteria bacterium]
MESRDEYLIKLIVEYCDDVLAAVRDYDVDLDKVNNSPAIRAMMAFFVMQIGESARQLSDIFKANHPEMEWKEIIGFRNQIAHVYGRVIPDILWDTVENDVPKLRNYCNTILGKK